jgi:hypothetical protein
MLFYVIYGSFPQEPRISGSLYRTRGLPREIELRRLTKEQRPVFPFCDEDFADLLSSHNASLFDSVKKVSQCLTLQGEVTDPRDLKYLRDCTGVVTYFMDHGGLAVLDPQQLKLYDGEEWRWTFFDSDQPNIFRHVLILHSAELTGEGRWYHTRGLRKFGRPDLSLRNVLPIYQEAAVELCNRFIELQAFGGIVPEGQEVRMHSLPRGLFCRHKGHSDDPDFNNLHIEICFPK